MKKLILFLLFLPTLAFAQIAEDQFYTYQDFSGMLNSQVSSFLISGKGAEEAQNVRSNELVGSLVKRDPMLLYGNCQSAAVNGLHRYYKSDATKFLIVASSTVLDLGDDNGGACTALGTGYTDGKRWSFLTYKDLAIGTNGFEQPIKYDGHAVTTDDTDGARTAGDLVTELGAPFAELNTGSNLDASSWYQYKIAYYDDTTYSFSSARSNPILTGATVRDIQLTDIPLGPSGTTQRIIYRTVGNASRVAVLADTSYYRVATISDNTTRTYADAITDATILGDSAPTWSTVSAGIDSTPPLGKLTLIHKERLFLANDQSVTFGKSTIYWSDTLNPDYFNIAADFELIGPDDGDEITFIKNLLGILTIGKTNTIRKFYTDTASSANWELSSPFSHIGNIATYSADNSPLGIIYLGEEGIYIFNGQNSQLISDKVTKEIRDILLTTLEEVSGVYYQNEYQLAYTSIESGAGQNDRVLVLDTVRNSYVVDIKDINVFSKFNSGTDFGTLYSGSSKSDGKIFAHAVSPNLLVYRLLSQLQTATVDSIVYFGTEDIPGFEIGWGVTLDSTVFSGETINSHTPATDIIDRPDTDGIWYGAAVNIKASDLSRLSWNEELGSSGDVTFALRTASTEAGLDSESWSSEFTDPSGSDVSGVTGNDWVELRATLSTTDITESPQVTFADSFVIKLSYTSEGTAGETSVLGIWKSKYDTLNSQQFANHPKRIKEVQVYYTDEISSGTIGFNITNLQRDTDASFSIDLSVEPGDSTSDDYYGSDEQKIYRYIPDVTDPITGRYFQTTISDTNAEPWKINKIVYVYDIYEYVTLP